MREIDRIMIDELGVSLLQMMENAGRSLAELIIRRFDPKVVCVIAGTGGNGGGGLAAARHLHNRGVQTSVTLTRREGLGAAASSQAQILREMGLTFLKRPDGNADLLVDALVGYSLSGTLRGPSADLAAEAGKLGLPIVSLDVPSGLNATSGLSSEVQIAADATLTLSLPKTGLHHAAETGDLYLADISVPPEVVLRVSDGPAPPFNLSSVLRISREA
jgi:NAD(P)H-hydrate epimerase